MQEKKKHFINICQDICVFNEKFDVNTLMYDTKHTSKIKMLRNSNNYYN